ncbi:hypothetical protein, partial [Sulfitobacter sp. HI0129]
MIRFVLSATAPDHAAPVSHWTRTSPAADTVGGDALGEETLEVAGRIAARTGCKLLAEWANARHERGAGRVFV